MHSALRRAVDVGTLPRATVLRDTDAGSKPGVHCGAYPPEVAISFGVADVVGGLDSCRALCSYLTSGGRLPVKPRQAFLAARKELRHAS